MLLMAPGIRAQSPASAAPAALGACVTCHGPEAEAGAQAPGLVPVPRVSGQHVEYLAKQLREYKEGRRKNDLMVPMLAKISNGQLRELAAHFASQPPARVAAENAQVAERGRTLYEQGTATVPACVGCHMSAAAGVTRYPRLAGQREGYVVQQLTNFKKGVRTNDRARVMRNIAAALSDEDITAVAQYLARLSGR
jgi:cytochrome c553